MLVQNVYIGDILALAAAFFARLLTTGSVYSWGLFYDAIQGHFETSNLQTSLAFALVQGLTQGAGLLIPTLMGVLAVRQLVISGGLLAAISVTAAVFIPFYWLFVFFFGFLQGLGQGIVFVVIPLAASRILPESRSHVAISITNSGDGFGLFLFPVIYEILLEHFTWRQALLVVSAIILNSILCGSLLTIKERVQERQALKNPQLRARARARSSKSLNLSPIRDDQSRISSTWSLSFHPSLDIPPPIPEEEEPSTLLKVVLRQLRLLKNTNFLLLFCTAILDSIAFSIFYTFISTHLRQQGAHLGSIDTQTLTIIGAVSIGGRLLVSIMNNRRIPRWLIFALAHAMQGLAMLCFVHLPLTRWSVVFSAVLLGGSAGMGGALLCCVCQDVCGVQLLPKVFSYSMFAWGVGSTIGPSLAGALKDLTGTAVLPITLAGSAFLCSGLLMLIFAKTAPKYYKLTWFKTPVKSDENLSVSVKEAEMHNVAS